MFAKIFHRLTTKIRRLGYAREHARFLAGFLVTGTTVVAALMGKVRAVQSETCDPMSGYCAGHCGLLVPEQYYAPFGIQRQTPV